MLDIKGKSVLLFRHGAYGDLIHVSHLPRLLKDQGCSFLGLSTNFKGQQIFANNPYVDTIHFFEHGGRDIKSLFWDGRLKVLSTQYDYTFDLTNTIEVDAIALEHQVEYYQNIEFRRRMGHKNYYDLGCKAVGFPELSGKYNGEVYFTEEETKIVEEYVSKYKDKFKVMVNLGGSSPHKVFIQAREVVEKILEKYPDAIVITTGAKNRKELDLKDLGDRVRSIVDVQPFRQALLLAKYMNCIIGCESGIMVGASMWGTPAIQLLTATTHECHCKYAKNDYSLQSEAYCSPCYKGPYKYYGCPKKNGMPLCVYFDVDKIMNQVEKIYVEQYSVLPVA